MPWRHTGEIEVQLHLFWTSWSASLPLHRNPRGQSPQYHLNTRLDGPQSGYRRFGEDKISCPSQDSNTGFSSPSHNIEWAIPDHSILYNVSKTTLDTKRLIHLPLQFTFRTRFAPLTYAQTHAGFHAKRPRIVRLQRADKRLLNSSIEFHANLFLCSRVVSCGQIVIFHSHSAKAPKRLKTRAKHVTFLSGCMPVLPAVKTANRESSSTHNAIRAFFSHNGSWLWGMDSMDKSVLVPVESDRVWRPSPIIFAFDQG